jgi:RNA polymerase subunit RPABC4/transcription elongation factor Spt4
MPSNETFHLNYYIGAVLAQGGNLSLSDSKIIFSPTSPIDRAMGATDVEIPFHEIQEVEFKGEMMRAFHVRTVEKIHKFQGSQAKSAWERLEKSLKAKESSVAVSVPASNPAPASPPVSASNSLNCDRCKSALLPGFSFCPSCGATAKSSCSSCHKAILSHWSHCAFCGWKFASKA